MSIQGVHQAGTRNDRYPNNKDESKKSTRTLADCLHFVTKLTEYQLKQMPICPNGEFHTCSTGKEALDMVNHIKSALRSKGFGCYALHNYVWIVPFVHQSLHMPDFERAKQVLPDLKSELLGKAFPDEDTSSSVKPKFDLKINKKTWLLVGGFVLILMLIF